MERATVSQEDIISFHPQPTLSLTLTQAGAGPEKRKADGQEGQPKKPRLSDDDDTIILHDDHQSKDIDISIDGNDISSPLMGSVKLAAILSKQGTSVQWQRCADLPVGTYDAQAVVLGDKVYVGSGQLKFPTKSPPYIYVYDATKDTWQLLASPCSEGALAVYHNQLVVAGGDECGGITNKVWLLDGKEEKWLESIPPMPTARRNATAMGIDDYLFVLGGSYDVVEIYDGNKWMKTDPLPVAYQNPWSVYHNGFCFIMGGWGQDNSVFYVSLESLIEKTNNPNTQPSVWKKLPDVPYTASSPAIYAGSLLAIGGHLGYQKQKAIHMFLPLTRTWIQIAEMPIEIDCTCAVSLPWGELLVIGGHMKGEVQEFIHEVHKANLKLQ